MSTLPPIHDFSKHLVAIEEKTKPKALPKVYIALCSRDWMVEHFTSESVRHFGRNCDCEIVVGYMANDGVARSRNNLAASFLETDCTHILFIDNDIIAMPRHLNMLLACEKDVIAGFYPKKQAKLDWVVNYLPDEGIREDGTMKVKHVGTGFVLISRRTFEVIIEKKPEIKYGGDPSPETTRWDFFPMHAKDGVYKSEDWFFCEMARECGIEVWIHTKIQLRHVGKIVYPLQFTLTDDEMVDLMQHRYGLMPDHIKTFMASGTKAMGLMGGHTERMVRFWPKDFPVGDLHQGGELGGCYDMPEFTKATNPAVILDIGANVGGFAIFASRRWEACTIHSWEGNRQLAECLVKTFEQIPVKFPKVTLKSYAEAATPGTNWPEATIVKVDQKDTERDIIQGMQSRGMLERVDYVLIRYYDDTVPLMMDLLLNQQFFQHCNQKFAAGGGVLKYANRRLTTN